MKQSFTAALKWLLAHDATAVRLVMVFLALLMPVMLGADYTFVGGTGNQGWTVQGNWTAGGFCGAECWPKTATDTASVIRGDQYPSVTLRFDENITVDDVTLISSGDEGNRSIWLGNEGSAQTLTVLGELTLGATGSAEILSIRILPGMTVDAH